MTFETGIVIERQTLEMPDGSIVEVEVPRPVLIVDGEVWSECQTPS